jgi:DNA-binding transcriptional regulator YiaG
VRIKITTNHAASSYGQPVILIAGKLQDYAPGIQAIRHHLGMNCAELGEHLGVSARTVEGWEQGRVPETRSLNALAALVTKKK